MAATKQSWKIEKVDKNTIREWYDVVSKTFLTPKAGTSQGFLDVFYPKGITQGILDWQMGGNYKTVEENQYFYYIIRDQSKPGDPAIAGARYQLVPAKTKEDFEQEEVEAAKERAEDEKNVKDVYHDRFEVFRVAQKEAKWRCLQGRQFLYLKVLGTHPDYQRMGVGTELLKWGMRKADEMGIESYLEASDAGKALYAKCGYEDRGLLNWDARKFPGIEDPFWNLAMVRPPGTGQIKA